MDLHETFDRDDEDIGSSDRGFGLTFAAIFGLIGGVRLYLGHDGWMWWLGGAVIALVLGLFWTAPLAPLNRAWTKLSLVMFKVVSPVVMGLLFFVTVTPMALLMRAMGKDLLRLKRDPAATTYWQARDDGGPGPDSMKNQF